MVYEHGPFEFTYEEEAEEGEPKSYSLRDNPYSWSVFDSPQPHNEHLSRADELLMVSVQPFLQSLTTSF